MNTTNNEKNTELQLINSIISYTESFIHKLIKQRKVIDDSIEKLSRQRDAKLKYRHEKWGIEPNDNHNQ